MGPVCGKRIAVAPASGAQTDMLGSKQSQATARLEAGWSVDRVPHGDQRI